MPEAITAVGAWKMPEIKKLIRPVTDCGEQGISKI